MGLGRELFPPFAAKTPETQVTQANIDNRLIDAAGEGDSAAVERLLAEGANPRALHSNTSMTALFSAAHAGNAALMRRLLPLSDPKQAGLHDEPLLFAAVSGGKAECVDLAIEHGLPDTVNAVNQWGMNAVCLAASLGHAKAMERLIERGASLSCATPLGGKLENGRNPLHWAALSGDINCARLALSPERAAARDEEGRTPFMLAAMGADAVDLLLLLAPDADLFAMDVDGRDALAVAASSGHMENVVHLWMDANMGRSAQSSMSAVQWALDTGAWECADWLGSRLPRPDREAMWKGSVIHGPLNQYPLSTRQLEARLPAWSAAIAAQEESREIAQAVAAVSEKRKGSRSGNARGRGAQNRLATRL